MAGFGKAVERVAAVGVEIALGGAAGVTLGDLAGDGVLRAVGVEWDFRPSSTRNSSALLAANRFNSWSRLAKAV